MDQQKRIDALKRLGEITKRAVEGFSKAMEALTPIMQKLSAALLCLKRSIERFFATIPVILEMGFSVNERGQVCFKGTPVDWRKGRLRRKLYARLWSKGLSLMEIAVET